MESPGSGTSNEVFGDIILFHCVGAYHSLEILKRRSLMCRFVYHGNNEYCTLQWTLHITDTLVHRSLSVIRGMSFIRVFGCCSCVEVLCIYRLYGPQVYIERVQKVVQSLLDSGLL